VQWLKGYRLTTSGELSGSGDMFKPKIQEGLYFYRKTYFLEKNAHFSEKLRTFSWKKKKIKPRVPNWSESALLPDLYKKYTLMSKIKSSGTKIKNIQ